ncbi:MAG: hypothetical protein FJ333_09515, partial [Sphingomonadales bacterium]|nr:hypothetical protein [Sphingomonadales bacterium]
MITGPETKAFKPKNPEVKTVRDYRVIKDSQFWKSFPTNDRVTAVSNIDYLKLKKLIDTFGTKDTHRCEKVLNWLKNGAEIGCTGAGRTPTVQTNSKDAYKYGPQVTDSVASWVKAGYVMGPVDEDDVPAHAKVNSIITRVKPNGAVRVILNLSSPKGMSVNDGIDI